MESLNWLITGFSLFGLFAMFILFIAVVILVIEILNSDKKYENRNRRVYPESTVKYAIEEFNKNKVQMSSEYGFMGEIDHPENGPIPVDENIKPVIKIMYVKPKRRFRLFRRK